MAKVELTIRWRRERADWRKKVNEKWHIMLYDIVINSMRKLSLPNPEFGKWLRQDI